MNVFILKLIALTTMIIDHYGAIFQNGVTAFRIIGRLAFPIYCFLLVEGYFHTADVKKYAKRLFVFALISEIPFDLAFYNNVGFVHQNIFFTLFIGLAVIYILDNKIAAYNISNTAAAIASFTVIIASFIAAIALSVDYNAIGIVYILTFYFTRDYDRPKKFITIGLIIFFVNLSSYWVQQFSLLALIPIYFYNQELGPKNKILQLSFYAVYPLHLIIFYFIKTI